MRALAIYGLPLWLESPLFGKYSLISAAAAFKDRDFWINKLCLAGAITEMQKCGHTFLAQSCNYF